MATQLDNLDDDLALRVDADEPDDMDGGADGGEGGGDDAGGADDDEDVVTLGGEAARADDESEGVRNLRTRLKEVERENRELKGAPKPDPLPAKPTLESCDYDEAAFEVALDAWKDRERAARDAERDAETRARRQQERFDQQRREFEDGWSGLRITGKDAARAKVEAEFTEQQQALLVKAARGNAAGLFFVLGSNPDRLKKLVDLKDDPADLIAEAAVLAKETQVTKRKPTTQPEQRHVGGSAGTGRGDVKLERLEREADKTGDRSALIAYRARLRDAGKR